jgi:hypothetical protein
LPDAPVVTATSTPGRSASNPSFSACIAILRFAAAATESVLSGPRADAGVAVTRTARVARASALFMKAPRR